MIQIQNTFPKNSEHVSRLLAFCKEVIAVCDDLNITPVLDGSLAVFGYTQSQAISVHDIDFSCSESKFPRLSDALAMKGIAHEVKEWHVLQVRKNDLKVEFGSTEYWMANVPEEYDTLVFDGYTFKVVSLVSLKELYRRGIEATANCEDDANRAKYSAIAEKYALLCSV